MSAIQEMKLHTGESASQSGLRLRVLMILTIITIVAVAFGLYLALFYAGTDVSQGEVQRIFYLHVASFAGAFMAFGATVVAGVVYLVRRNVKWDTLALAGVEVGLALALINLFTGMVWARPIWNTWWTWDPRLTSDAIMILTYAAYLMLRNGIENPEQRRRFAAVYGILAFTTVIITLVIIRIEPRTIHPVVIGDSPQGQSAEGGFDMSARMTTVLGVNSFIWTVFVPLALIWWRIRLQNFADQVAAARMHLLNKSGE